MNKERIIKYAVTILCLIFMVYIIIRTFTVDITYDEYGSYLYLIHMKTLDLFVHRDAWLTANNHVINTICMQIGHAVFGPELPALRWGSVVAGGVFLFYAYRFIDLINPVEDWRFLFLFFILISYHFGIEFFSLARGYGMVYAMVMGVMYYFRKILIRGEHKYFIYGSLLVCFGLFINLTTSIVFSAWFFMTFIVYLFQFKIGFKNYLKQVGKVLPAVILTLAIFYKPVSILREQGELEYGPANFTDTLMSLYNNYIGHGQILREANLYNIFAYLLGIIFSGIFIYSIVKMWKKVEDRSQTSLFFMSMFLTITMLINVALHHTIGANYLTGRTSILYIPIFSAVLVSFLAIIPNLKVRNISITLFVLINICNLVDKVKFDRCDEWWFDRDSNEFAEAIMADHDNLLPVYVSGDGLLVMSPNFYVIKNGYQNIKIGNKGINTEVDFTVDPQKVQYFIIFNNNLPHLKNKYTVLYKGLYAQLVRIEKQVDLID